MTLYQKVLSVFGLLRESIGLRAAREELAPPFDAARSYDPGRLVVYANALYRCVEPHMGAWDSSHFTETTIDAAISDPPDLTDYVQKDDVVPAEIPDGVTIATIGGKDIKAPAGGSGGYRLATVTPTEVGDSMEAHVEDYTISTITVTSATQLKIFLPTNTTDRSLNLIVRIVVDRMDALPSVVFVPPASDIEFESEEADWMSLDLGVNLFTFTGMTHG